MEKEIRESDEGISGDIIKMGGSKQFEIWLTWWHWALPLIVGYIPEIKRFYMQIFCLNIAIGFKQP